MDLIVVDCQNDFIDGTVACLNANIAVDKIVESFKENMNVYYTSDFHPQNHMSFSEQGGTWPPHCVAGTWGAELSEKFSDSKYAPTAENVFYKGENPDVEEYSGFSGKNEQGEYLKEKIGDKVYIAGIASEFCVRETALAFKNYGKEVVVLKDLLGYVNEEQHLKNLKELQELGITVE